VENESTLSDALLRQLIAVGQVDILVGLPTLNNAATIVSIVRAVHECFTRDFARLRTVIINSDGGSTDGTPDLIRDATFTDADMVQTSHSLRTLHRVSQPSAPSLRPESWCRRKSSSLSIPAARRPLPAA
jgi:glycosyltransferase involved in cell wall biosynthesis